MKVSQRSSEVTASVHISTASVESPTSSENAGFFGEVSPTRMGHGTVVHPVASEPKTSAVDRAPGAPAPVSESRRTSTVKSRTFRSESIISGGVLGFSTR